LLHGDTAHSTAEHARTHVDSERQRMHCCPRLYCNVIACAAAASFALCALSLNLCLLMYGSLTAQIHVLSGHTNAVGTLITSAADPQVR
jgi:hypothetical protein